MKSLFLIITSAILQLFLQIDSLKSEEISIKNVRYLIPEKYEWSDSSDIIIAKGKIHSIRRSSSNKKLTSNSEKSKFAIPSFCDAYVTIGADSLGYQNNFSGIKKALLSFLQHGFTKIQLIGDGHWVRVISDEINRGKIPGPEIVTTERPIVVRSKETENLSDDLYFVPKDFTSLEKEIHVQTQKKPKIINLFYRYSDESSVSFDIKLLNKIVNTAKQTGKIINVSTFADRQSILESLAAGVRTISHPIGTETSGDFSPLYKHELNWIPLFNVYYFQKNQGSQTLKKDFQYMKEKSPFFRSQYADSMENALTKNTLLDLEIAQAQKEFNSYMIFFNENQSLSEKMILGSGSGNLFSFPGISGLMELKIIHAITRNLKGILKIATENSCSFLSSEKEGMIKEGAKANLIVLKENPLLSFDNLFQIESVYKNGKKVVGVTEIETKPFNRKNKNRGKHGKKEK